MTNNTKEIFYVIYCLMNLVTLEAGDQDALVDVIHFCFEIQVNPLNEKQIEIFLQSAVIKITDDNQRQLSRYSIHALIAAYFNLMSKLYGITEFSDHVDEVNRPM